MDGRRTTIDDLLQAETRSDRIGPGQVAGALDRGAVLVDIRSELQRQRDGEALVADDDHCRSKSPQALRASARSWTAAGRPARSPCSGVASDEQGVASALVQSSFRLGGALGLAIVTAVVTAVVTATA